MNAGPKIILKSYFYVIHYISLTLLYYGNDKITTQTQIINVSKHILNLCGIIIGVPASSGYMHRISYNNNNNTTQSELKTGRLLKRL